jgi:FkbM family methyltransferase
MSLKSQAYRVLTEEGLLSLVNRASKYLFENVYWKYKNIYTISINGVNVSFFAPNRKVVKRNKGRSLAEYNIISDVIQESDSSDVFYDIGANTGLYTRFAAKKCSKVVSFEPYSPNYKFLNKDLSENSVSNVDVYKIALSDSNGTVLFEQPTKDDIGYGSSSIVDKDTSSSVEVPTKRGDDLISEDGLPTPNIVKIDIEGSEPLVIDGLEDTLSRSNCRLVYCEIHTKEVNHRPTIYDFDTSPNDIKSQLKSYGFMIEEVADRGGELFIKASK